MDETPASHFSTVASLYAALLDRAPEASGLGYWAGAAANGASWTAIAHAMLAAPAVRDAYPAAQSAGDFVSRLYQTLFDRAPDAPGLAFWLGVLQARGAGDAEARAWLLLQILDSASQPPGARPDAMDAATYAQALADHAVLANKIAAGVHFATVLGSEDLALARDMLAAVTADPASLQVAIGIAQGSPPVTPPPSPPAAPTITSVALTHRAEPLLTGESAVGTGVSVVVGGATYVVAVTNGIWRLDLSAATPVSGTLSLNVNGDNPVQVVARTAAGGLSTVTTQTLVIDTTAPEIPAITSPAQTQVGQPVLTGTAEPGAAVTLSLGGATYLVVARDGTWQVDLRTATPASGTLALDTQGANPVSVVATDAAGNASPAATQTLEIGPQYAPAPQITRADSLLDMQRTFDAYPWKEARVSAEGLSAEQWAVVVTQLGKVGAEGISGRMLLTDALAATDALALLGKYAGSQATLDARPHGLTDVLALLADARVQRLTNLEFALADLPLASLAPALAKAPDASIDTTGAAAEALTALAALTTPASTFALTGVLTLGAAVAAEDLGRLLAHYAPNELRVHGAGASVAQLALLNGHLDQVARGGISGQWTLTAEAMAAGAATFFDKLAATVTLTVAYADLTAPQRETLGLHLLTHPLPAGTALAAASTLRVGDFSTAALAGWLKSFSFKVDVTAAPLEAWHVLAARVSHIEAGGLGGTVSIPSGLSAAESAVLLERYAGTTAQVDVANLTVAALAQLHPVLAKIAPNGLLNLSLTLGDPALADDLTSALLTHAGGARVDATGATLSELRLVGNAPGKLADGGITGLVTITQDLNLAQQLSLLGVKLAATAQLQVVGTNLDATALKAVAARAEQLVAAGISGRLHFNSQLSATEMATLIQHFGGTFISAHLAGMNAQAVAQIAAAWNLFFGLTGAVALPGSLPLAQVQGLLSQYADTAATITDATYDLATLEQLALDDKVRLLAAPKLVIDDALGNPSAQLGHILAKSQNARIDNATGNDAYVTALLDQLGAIASAGILNWGAADRIALDRDTLNAASFATFVSKLGGGLTLAIDAAHMNAAQVIALFNNADSVAALSNLAVPAGVFGQIATQQLHALFRLQVGIQADLSGASDPQLAVVAQYGNHLASDGLTGTFTLSAGLTPSARLALLRNATPDATVTIDASGMNEAQLQALANLSNRADSIVGLSIDAATSTLDVNALATLLNKATGATLDLQGASQALVNVALANLPAIADGGLAHANLDLDLSHWQALSPATLSAKLSSDAVLRITGSAGDDTLDLTQLTRHVTVDAGAGADRILLPGGPATVQLGGRGDNTSAAFASTDHGVDHLDVLVGVHNGVKLQLSTALGAYADGVQLDADTTVVAWWTTTSYDAATTFDDLYRTATAMNGGVSPSTADQLQVRGVQYRDAANVAHHLVFINNGDSVIDRNDFVVDLIGSGMLLLTV